MLQIADCTEMTSNPCNLSNLWLKTQSRASPKARDKGPKLEFLETLSEFPGPEVSRGGGDWRRIVGLANRARDIRPICGAQAARLLQAAEVGPGSVPAHRNVGARRGNARNPQRRLRGRQGVNAEVVKSPVPEVRTREAKRKRTLDCPSAMGSGKCSTRCQVT